jgi:hypothetical protein
VSFAINARVAEVRWSKGSCGQIGCSDPECVCALCARPLGVPETDPRWDEHSDCCVGCELCLDAVPIILFRGELENCEQAAFHQKCFEELLK